MVTNNAWNSQNPAQVAKGGTGAATLTGLLNGNGTSAITGSNLAVTNNTISSSNTDGTIILDPNGSGLVTVVAEVTNTGLNVSGTIAGGNVLSNVSNSDNTNSASDAQFRVVVGGSSGGDPFLNVSVNGGGAYGYGIDNSDSDNLKEYQGGGTPSAGTTLRKMTSAGIQTLPLQPSFAAYVDTTITNVTGNGAQYQIVSNWTELFDTVGNFSAGVFTAPAAGVYQFNGTISIQGIAAATSINCQFLINGSSSYYFHESLVAAAAASGRMGLSGSIIISLAASDTVVLRVQVQGEVADTVDVAGAAGPFLTYFSGCLLA
jgi:hypothetical protein